MPALIEGDKSFSSTKKLILKLENFEDVVVSAAKSRAPYLLCRYAQELASDFHQFYANARVLNVEEDVMKARLAIVLAFKQVLATVLNLLGVSAPEKM